MALKSPNPPHAPHCRTCNHQSSSHSPATPLAPAQSATASAASATRMRAGSQVGAGNGALEPLPMVVPPRWGALLLVLRVVSHPAAEPLKAGGPEPPRPTMSRCISMPVDIAGGSEAGRRNWGVPRSCRATRVVDLFQTHVAPTPEHSPTLCSCISHPCAPPSCLSHPCPPPSCIPHPTPLSWTLVTPPSPIAGIQKGPRSDFDLAYERGRISVSLQEDRTSAFPTFSRVKRVGIMEENPVGSP